MNVRRLRNDNVGDQLVYLFLYRLVSLLQLSKSQLPKSLQTQLTFLHLASALS
jgi:hypothetical protein